MAPVQTIHEHTEHAPAVKDGEPPFLLRNTDSSEGGTLAPGMLGPNMLVREHAGGIDVFPIVHPDRQRPKLDFAKAWHHFKIVVKDKEQTEEIVAVIDALPWRGVGDAAAAFLATERGRAIFQTEPFLPDFLDDHAALRRTPKGSLAHAYCDFMEREGLTAAGIVESTIARENDQAFDDGVGWYIDRLRDVHDLIHILTGYGRDIFSEQCVFAYIYPQRPSPGHLGLAWAGTLRMKVKMKSRAPIIRALIESVRHGKLCPRLVEQPIHELFSMPLDAVRKKLNVPDPRWYWKVLDVWRSEGVDPHTIMAKQAG